jgi:hypothetical protein
VGKDEGGRKELSQPWDGRMANFTFDLSYPKYYIQIYACHCSWRHIHGKEIEIAKKLRNDMQDNHSQWHVERSSTKKVNSVTEGVNEDLTAKVDELIGIIKGKEEIQVNAITNAKVEEIDFMARNFNPA